MFSIGFGEIFIVLLVVILFVNPKDLPRLFRTIGRYYGKFLKLREELSRSLKLLELEAAAREEEENKDDKGAALSESSAGGELKEPLSAKESADFYKEAIEQSED